MAKAKTVVAVWQCTETGRQTGVFKIKREGVKELTRKKYNPAAHKHTLHKAKIVKSESK